MSAPGRRLARNARYTWAFGAALLVLAARLAEVHAWAGDVPFNDQWQIEANDILLRWFEGTLRPWHFFASHFEHIPVWTRLGVWLEVVLTGRWDPRVQMTVNAMLYAAFAGWVVHTAAASLARLPAALLTALVVALGSFPHAWENIVWGFQSQFPLALLALVIHVHGSFHHAPGTRGWWLAQGAGLAGLFTLGSMALAPLAVVLVQLWTEPRRARTMLFPGLLAIGGLLLAGWLRLTAHADIVAHSSTSGLSFADAVFDMLGWPTAAGGGAVLMYAPLLIFGLQMRSRTDGTPLDRTILALGVWSAAHVLVLAYARGGDYGGYVSRYGDLLAIGVLANGFALARWLPSILRPWPLALGAAAAWLGVVGVSLHDLSTSRHAHYFHEHAHGWAAIRQTAVEDYLTKRDFGAIASDDARAVLFGAPEQVARALDHPRIRAALPASVNPANSPDLLGRATRQLQANWKWLASIGAACLLLGLLARRSVAAEPPPFAFRADGMQACALAVLGLAATAALLCWPRPFLFAPSGRWDALLAPPGVVGDLHYEFVGPAPVPAHRIWGAADLWPPEYRNRFSGSRPDLSMPIAEIRSMPFRISAPWLIVPIAGFPASAGNSLRLQVFGDEAANPAEEIAYPGTNPTPGELQFWSVDVSRHQGREARLRIIDTRGETEDWLAAGPPVLTTDGAFAAQAQREQRFERFAALHATLGWLALVSLSAAAVAAVLVWRRRRVA